MGVLLLVQRTEARRLDAAHGAALRAADNTLGQLNAELEKHRARVHQLEAIADAYRIEGLKNPGAVPNNVAPMGGELRELAPEYRSFLDGYEDPDAREEAEAFIRSAVLQNPSARPRDVLRGLVS